MGLFDIFTGDAYTKAAEQQRQYLQGVQGQIGSGIGQTQQQGLGALQSGQANAIGALQQGYGGAQGAIGQYLPQAIAALQQGAQGGQQALGAGQAGGLEALRSGVNQATSAYDPLALYAGTADTRGVAGGNIALGAYGLGPNAAGIQAGFQASPGLKFATDQGLEAILRNANASGMAAGGNQLREAQTFGQGLAQQDYNNWRAGVSGIGQGQQSLYGGQVPGLLGTAATGQANAALTGGTGAANIYTGTGGRLSDLLSSTGQGLANTYTGAGTNLANLSATGGLNQANVYNQTGANISNLLNSLSQQQTSSLGNLAGQTSGTYNTEAAGITGGSQNLWNLIGGLATAGAGSGMLGGGLQSFVRR
jgi:hypothetical protein